MVRGYHFFAGFRPGGRGWRDAPSDPAVGREAIVRDARSLFSAFPDRFTRIEAMHEAGEWVMLEWSGGGTWQGEFAGRQPNGKTFTMRGCGFFRVLNGLIVFQRGYWDRAGWFLQLGIPVE